jgi:hypothetical protein
MQPNLSLIAIALAAVSLVSCETGPQMSSPREASAVTVRMYTPSEQGDGQSEGDDKLHLDSMWAELKIIRTAGLQIEVASVAASLGEVRRIAKDHSGFVAGSNVTRDREGNRSGSFVVRVPSINYEAALSALKELGDLEQENGETRDVTKAYADMETRLRVKRSIEERLLELLRSRTGELADVLKVERELERIVTEIEQLEGEKRFYDQQIAVSTINLKLHEPGATVESGWWSAIASSFSRSVEVLTFSLSALVYVMTFVVPWLVVACVMWPVVRILKRRHRSRQEKPE